MEGPHSADCTHTSAISLRQHCSCRCLNDRLFGHVQPKKNKPAAAKIQEKTHFHGKHEVDPITKRSWIEAPKEKRKENDYCYLPKKHIHTWSGHTKGVNAIRWVLSLTFAITQVLQGL